MACLNNWRRWAKLICNRSSQWLAKSTHQATNSFSTKSPSTPSTRSHLIPMKNTNYLRWDSIRRVWLRMLCSVKRSRYSNCCKRRTRKKSCRSFWTKYPRSKWYSTSTTQLGTVCCTWHAVTTIPSMCWYFSSTWSARLGAYMRIRYRWKTRSRCLSPGKTLTYPCITSLTRLSGF